MSDLWLLGEAGLARGEKKRAARDMSNITTKSNRLSRITLYITDKKGLSWKRAKTAGGAICWRTLYVADFKKFKLSCGLAGGLEWPQLPVLGLGVNGFDRRGAGYYDSLHRIGVGNGCH